eukprot:TRINITY_DN19521_c0_g1_i1.p1 TRINITY_DN19521_c0_g1~~TRINITY_DN19521_c0_g1_i1.p1  ORF type:complete len:180 (+),score=26.65 TRINITY_DN19521_c0_g1_i1:124-663(+)
MSEGTAGKRDTVTSAEPRPTTPIGADISLNLRRREIDQMDNQQHQLSEQAVETQMESISDGKALVSEPASPITLEKLLENDAEMTEKLSEIEANLAEVDANFLNDEISGRCRCKIQSNLDAENSKSTAQVPTPATTQKVAAEPEVFEISSDSGISSSEFRPSNFQAMKVTTEENLQSRR